MQKICVIKAGSAVVTQRNGSLDLNVIQQLCDEIADLRKHGWAPILVTSGAVAAGRGWLGRYGEVRDVEEAEAQLTKRIHAALGQTRSEEHTSELQSPDHLVCRLLLEKKKSTNSIQFDRLIED